MFKEGDVVKCVRGGSWGSDEVKAGLRYTVRGHNLCDILLVGQFSSWDPSRFVLCEDTRTYSDREGWTTTATVPPGAVSTTDAFYMSNNKVFGNTFGTSSPGISLGVEGGASIGIKHDQGKLQFGLILPEFEEAMAAVLTRGAEKYPDPTNWMKNDRQRYVHALMRHLNAMRKGEVMDDGPGGTGQPHSACVAVNAMFLYWFDTQDTK